MSCGNSEVIFNSRLLFAVWATVLGSAFLHAFYDVAFPTVSGEINDWLKSINNDNKLFSTIKGTILLNAYFFQLFAAFLGSLASGFIATKFGPRRGLVFNNITVFIALISFTLAKYLNSCVLFIIGRFICGLNCGINLGLAMLYLAEISPKNMRGAICTTYPLIYYAMFNMFYFFPYFCYSDDTDWLAFLSITMVPAIFQIFNLYFCPETPYFTLIANNEEESKKSLQWFHGKNNVETELDEMKMEYKNSQAQTKSKVSQMFTDSSLRTPLFISVVLMASLVFSGKNEVHATLYYFLPSQEMDGLKIQIGLVLTSIFCIYVSKFFVELLGRRTLLMNGLIVMIFSILNLSVCVIHFDEDHKWVSDIALLCIFIFHMFFYTGPANIPFFYAYDWFNHSLRPVVTSFLFGVYWIYVILQNIFYAIQEHDMSSKYYILCYLLLPSASLSIVMTCCLFKTVPSLIKTDNNNKTSVEINVNTPLQDENNDKFKISDGTGTSI